MKSIETATGYEQEAVDGKYLPGYWDSLEAVLAQEIAVYGELNAICLKERDVLVHFSAEDLLENNSRKETILLKARLIEESRIKLVARIAEALGIPSDSVNLTTLISYAGGQGDILRKSQVTLRRLLEDLNEMNSSNKVLLDSSLLYVQKSIDFISRLITPPSQYGTDGEMKASPPSGRLVSRKG